MKEGLWEFMRDGAENSGERGPTREEMRILLLLDPFGLTKKEIEIALFLAQGMPREAILGNCGITNNTLKFHVKQIYRKLGVSNRKGLTDRLKMT